MESETTLGELLREFRIAANLTQGGLAEKAGLSEQAVSLLERGTRRRPRISTVRALAEALGLDAEAEERLAEAARGRRTAASPQPRTSAREPVPPPRQLPPTLADFTARTGELDALISVLTSDSGAGIVRAAAVTGMGGVGKTSLAVHAAHLTADAFPDGHLYLDLRGYGPGDPVQPIDALSQLLRSLGVDGHSIPESVDEAAALYRSRIAGLRMLVLLDNANSAAQVRALLPGAPGSAVVVTSRRGLTALPGFVQVSLSPLSENDSISLLGKIVGERRVAAEAEAARTIARLTGRLPLAVRLIGARLAARPGWPVEHVVDQLQDEKRRLSELGSDLSGVRSNIAASVEFLATGEELDRRAAAALDLLGLPNGTDLLTATVARLLDEPEDLTEQMLERLVDLNLLISLEPGRYRLHDLIRAYARERADQVLSEGVRTDALARVLTFYTGMAWRCQEQTHAANPRLGMAGDSRPVAPPFADTMSAIAWLNAEQTNIAEAFQQARRMPALQPLIPEFGLALFGYYETLGRWNEMRTVCLAARSLASDLGFHRLAAWLEHDLAIPDAESGQLELSLRHLRAAEAMFEAVGDLLGRARCSTSLSRVLERMGRWDEAVVQGEQALALSQQLGDTTIEGTSYLALGSLYLHSGDLTRADRSFTRAIALSSATGNDRSTAKRYQNSGQAYLRAGLLEKAAEQLVKGIEFYRRALDSNGESESCRDLADLYISIGRPATARTYAETGLRLARKQGNLQREGELLIQLGRIALAEGDIMSARADWQKAVALLRSQAISAESVALELLAANPEPPPAAAPETD